MSKESFIILRIMTLLFMARVLVLTNEQVILNYHNVEFTPGIFLTGGLWPMILESGMMVDDIWELNGIFYTVSSRLSKVP